jgi:hypothetical protein
MPSISSNLVPPQKERAWERDCHGEKNVGGVKPGPCFPYEYLLNNMDSVSENALQVAATITLCSMAL